MKAGGDVFSACFLSRMRSGEIQRKKKTPPAALFRPHTRVRQARKNTAESRQMGIDTCRKV